MAKTWEQKALEMKWHEFVCTYVANKTARRKDGHKLRRSGSMWELTFGGLALFAPMSASTAYSWFFRTADLYQVARDADTLRERAHVASGRF
jgi:hypothetical protein